jgi:hypothetical protein
MKPELAHLQNAGLGELIAQLRAKAHLHDQVGDKLTDAEIAEFERVSGFKVPPSYRTFLREFGDGAYWLYDGQPMDSIGRAKSRVWFEHYRPEASAMIPVDGGGVVAKDSLFCLMTEDSNGGAWCWLTSLPDAQGEYPLAYYSEGTLYYRLPNFTEWLRVLVLNEDEVIRALDTEDKCGLG